MKDVFIPTQNFQKFEGLCGELLGSGVGIEMAAVIGRAGRGKSTAAERLVTNTPQAVYVRFEERFSHVGLIREIAFAVAGFRPRSTDGCVDHIKEEFSRERKVIIVDEADRMSMKHLNTMRDFHDVCRVPVVLIGEESLHNHLQRERRLESRVREEMTFEPISQSDVAIFYRKALDQALKPEASSQFHLHAQGDWRAVLKDALKAERYMKASGLREITDAVVKEVVNGASA
jgi:DNA transposition AAA+ family ATPase